MKVSVIIPCKKRIKYLKRTFKQVVKQDYQDLEIIMVDFNCPEGSQDWVDRHFKFDFVKTVKAEVPADYWNLSESRNFGYKNSTGEILIFLDADTDIHYKFVSDCVKKLQEGFYLSGKQAGAFSNCGCCAVFRKDFEKVKGYNEALKGWGSEDLDIYRRLEEAGLTNRTFNFGYIKNIPHADSIRNEFHGNQGIYTTNSINANVARQDFKGI
jgi:glycosyltransferase involved in cell wall biosynthesis